MKLTILVAIAASAACASAFAPVASPRRGSTSLRLAEEEREGAEKGEGAPSANYRSALDISSLTADVKTLFSLEDITKVLPHGLSSLMIDKVVEYEAGKRAVGIKCITINEPCFEGHFPGRPIMPGVLQVRGLLHLAGFVCLQLDGVDPEAPFLLTGVDGIRWKRPVVPGDTLVMEVEIIKHNTRFGIATAAGRGYVDGEMAIEVGEIKFVLVK